MPKIRVRDNEPIENAIRRFKNKCENAGVIQDCRKKEFYEKPTSVKKRKKKEAANRTRSQQIKNEVVKKRLY
jgi:small subunit ribosomal protein S21